MNLNKRYKIKKTLNYIFVFNILGIVLTGLFLLIGNRYDLMGWANSVTFTALLMLALLWLTFANNKGAFDILVFGAKSFFNAFKKDYVKLDYFEYSKNKDKVSKEFYLSLIITFAIYILPAIVLLILVS